MMVQQELEIGGIPAVLYGEAAARVWLYIHGKKGCKEEATAFARAACARGWQVLSVDLPGHGARKEKPDACNPWMVVPELRTVMDWSRPRWQQAAVYAVSIGAYFAMLAFEDVDRALLVSPVLDMEGLICEMMRWAGVDEAELRAKGEIPTGFGETLSCRYLDYVRAHPVHLWRGAVRILYPERDNMTPRQTAERFARRQGASLTIAPDGEHWFHTPEQLAFLRAWERECL